MFFPRSNVFLVSFSYDSNLKLARFTQDSWDKEVVASTGDIGLYNNLWFDENGHPLICSYSTT